jgi:hypothetical protein
MRSLLITKKGRHYVVNTNLDPRTNCRLALLCRYVRGFNGSVIKSWLIGSDLPVRRDKRLDEFRNRFECGRSLQNRNSGVVITGASSYNDDGVDLPNETSTATLAMSPIVLSRLIPADVRVMLNIRHD